MPRTLQPAPAEEVRAALAVTEPGRAELRLLTRHYLAVLQQLAPGASVEVRVPPYAAVQVVPGVRHTRGTPPAVVELDAATCRLIVERFRYRPALDAAGRPTTDVRHWRQRWWLERG